MTTRKEFNEWFAKSGRKMGRCDCGCPELGHAPDCSYLRRLDDLWECFMEEIEEDEEDEEEFDTEWRREMAREAGMGLGIDAYNDVMWGGCETVE